MLYLVHFDWPFGHARHDLGYAENAERRMRRHLAGRGSRLLAYVIETGIGVTLARTWEDGDREQERRLKRRGGRGRPGAALVSRLDGGLAFTDSPARVLAFTTVQ